MGFLPAIVLLALIFPGNVISQNLPYGLSVNLNHKATLITQTMAQNQDVQNIPPTQATSYFYDLPLSETDVYGNSGSNLRAEITPGVIRCGWLGTSSVSDGVGNTNATIYTRSDVYLSLRWNDSITVSSRVIPTGTEVTLIFSHSLHGNISPGIIAPFNAFLNIRADATFYSNTEQLTSEFSTSASIDDYNVISLKTRIGDTINYNMGLSVNSTVHTDVYAGLLTENCLSSTYINVGGLDSNRLGIRAADTNVTLTSASGHIYPSHAMSPTKVTGHLAIMKIKKADYVLGLGTVTFVIDAVPGVKYLLQRSDGANLGSWKDVGTPEAPLNFGEMALTDSIPSESSSFWRIAATPLP